MKALKIFVRILNRVPSKSVPKTLYGQEQNPHLIIYAYGTV